MELHEIKTKVLIQQVKLNVRFPGQLSFSFKNPHLYQEMTKMYPLTNGECIVSESIQFTQEASYNTKTERYKEVNVDLSVSINTSSGKIVAGTVAFNSAENKEEVVPLKRCSDKNASVSLVISIQKISKIKDLEEVAESEKNVEVSPIKQIYIGKRMPPTARLKPRQQQEKVSSQSSSKNILNSHKSIGKVGNVDSRIKQLEENQERKLKALNQEKKDLEEQLEKTKEKWRLSERKQKEAQNLIKEQKDSNQKKRMKILQLQSKLMDNDRLVFQNEKKLKVFQAQLKSLYQKITSYESKIASLEKKNQVKDQIFGEREKRLMEKINTLESNGSKALQDYNALIEKMEAQEKINQGNVKAKQKGFVEEKMKWKELSEQFQQKILNLTKTNEELMQKVDYLSKMEEQLTIRSTEAQKQLHKTKEHFDVKRIELEKQQKTKEQLEKDLSNLEGVQNDKANLKKKVNQQAQEYQKLKDKFDKLILDYQQQKENLKNTEDQIQELRKEKKNLLSKNTEVEKKNVNLDKEVSKLLNENNNLSSKNTYLNQRINDLKTKQQQKERQFSEDQINSNNTINSILQSKQYLENDVQDLKWALEKEKDKINETEKKIKEKNQIILNKEEEALKFQKQIENLIIKEEEYLAKIEGLNRDLGELRKKQGENLEQSKEKDLKIYEFNKKIAELQQENFLSSTKFKSSNSQKENLISSQAIKIKQLTVDLQETKTKLTELEFEHEQLQDKCRQFERNLKMTSTTLEQSEKLCSENEHKNLQLKKEIENLKKKLEEIEEHKSLGEKQYDQKVDQLKNKLELTEKQVKSKQSDIETFKKSVKQLLLILSSIYESDDNIIALPDSDLAKNQMQALMVRNKNIQKMNQKILEYEVEINYLHKENETKTNNLHAKEEELLQAIKNHKDKITELQQEWNTAKESLIKTIQKIETQNKNISTEKEKLETKLKGVNELLDEEKRQKEEIQLELQKTKENHKKLESKVLEIREREISKKSEDQTLIHNIKVELIGEIEAYKEQISNLLKQKEGMEKMMIQKEKTVNSNNSKISELENEIIKNEEEIKSLKDLGFKKDEDRSLIDQKHQQQKKKAEKLQQYVQKMEYELKSEKQLKEQIESKLNETRQEVSELSIEKENILNKFKQTQENSSATTEELRAKIILLEDNLQAETKKRVKLNEDLSKAVNDLKIKEFEVKQLKQQVQHGTASLQAVRKENEQKKIRTIQLEKAIQQLKHKIIESEKLKSDQFLEKGIINEELNQLKSQIQDKDIEIKDLNIQIEELSHALEDLNIQNEKLEKEKSNLVNANSELKDNLTSAKKDVQLNASKAAQLRSRLAIIQDQLKEKEQFYQNNKNKNWEENQKQINSLKSKLKKCEDELLETQRLLQKERADFENDSELLQQDKQELQAMLEERENLIQRQEEEIISGQNRIISLNKQLRNCIEAWEKEKIASLPSRKQASKIEQDLVKFQQYASDLNKKTKESLKSMGSRVKDQLIAKIGQQLVELLDYLNRSKIRVLSNLQQEEKELVNKEYDSLKLKIQQILQNQKGSLVLDSP